MKIYVIGIRGFPNVQGGAEKRCEKLFTRLAKFGLDIKVFARKSYFPKNSRLKEWNGIKFLYLFSPRIKGFETFIHSFVSSLICLFEKPDVLHYQNMGPALFLPMTKFFGIKTIVTFDSINYLHQKWGWFAKFILKLGEYFSVKFADKIIVVSKYIENYLEKKYKKNDFILIPNGVEPQEILPPGETLKKFNLEPKKYIFNVSRLVPEKGLHDLILAYRDIKNPQFKLVIVGDADHETSYSKNLKKLAQTIPGIVLTGVLTGRPLQELYSNARLFVLPSYYEGLPLALLEALSYGLPVLVSDIPAHREIPLPNYRYFHVGDYEELKQKILELYNKGISDKEKEFIFEYLKENHNWDKIAERVLEVYKNLVRF
ncbi:MAG: glycosyltransferase family 4 protein [Elusimicrobiota bacterium]|nr:glycosyltransferase family 4 protein [Endomicrobiia bacterium]MDW8166396.1 glycosyltransferase family 4 protein [Elusimicrobiota bacterium]